MKTALRASESFGIVGIVTHPLDDGLRGFYARWGFRDLLADPRLAMFVRMADRRHALTASEVPGAGL